MGVAKRGQRKIVRNNRTFYWSVRNDDDHYYRLHLIIKSEDKKFIVSYMLEQKNRELPFSPKVPLIIVKGKEFKGLSDLGHVWERFIVPEWEDTIVTPSLVAQVIDWCFTTEDVTPVDWEGNVLKSRLDDRCTEK